MIAWIKKNWDLAWGIILLMVVNSANAWNLRGLAAPDKEMNAWMFFGALVLGLIMSILVIAHMLYRNETVKAYVWKLATRMEDEVRHLEDLRIQIGDELDTSGQAIDHTMLGAFLFARQRILSNDELACASNMNDWNDREFDSIFIVKRKSTPIDEVLQAVHEAGKM